jgi:hypothetical protein
MTLGNVNLKTSNSATIEDSQMYYVIYKSFRPLLSFFGDLYSKVLVICIRFYQVPNIIDVNYPTLSPFPRTFVLTKKLHMNQMYSLSH